MFILSGIRNVLQARFAPSPETYNGDSILTLTRGEAAKETAKDAAKDPEEWIERQTNFARHSPEEALELAANHLRGRALLKYITKKPETWSEFETWFKSVFQTSETQRVRNFAAYLETTRRKHTVMTFITGAVVLAKKTDLSDRNVAILIMEHLPSHLKKSSESKGVKDIEDLIDFAATMEDAGNLFWETYTKTAEKKPTRKTIVCFSCKKEGHIARRCPTKKESDKLDRVLCCKDEDRPIKVKGRVNNTQADMLVDTGARDLYMSEVFAEKSQTEKGESKTVCVANGATLAFDTEKDVTLLFRGKEQKVKGTIIPDLIEDVVIGRNPLASAGAVIDVRKGTVSIPKLGGADIGALDTQEVAPDTALPKTLGDARKELKAVLS
ncbi:MAG: uncharacterized protein A8A55_3172, partial [Amphiamblys sp. WSBS2006]